MRCHLFTFRVWLWLFGVADICRRPIKVVSDLAAFVMLIQGRP